MGKPESQKIRKWDCILCDKPIQGYRTVGDHNIRDAHGHIIAFPGAKQTNSGFVFGYKHRYHL